MFSSIRVRLTLWYVALLALILALFSVAVYWALAQSLYRQVDDNLTLVAQQLEGTINSQNGRLSFAVSEDSGSSVQTARDRGYLVWLIDATGKAVDAQRGTARLPIPDLVPTFGSAERTVLATVALDGGTYRGYTALIEENSRAVGMLQVAASLADVNQTLRSLRWALAFIIPLTLLVASAGGVLFAARALAPVDQITRAAQTISAADLSQRLALRLPNDELGRLARTFDDMLTRLDDAFRREREFTANASHELRTPLTVMRGEIDVALQRTRSAAEYQGTLHELGEDVERLTRLAEDLLLLARADARQLPWAPEPVSTAMLFGTLHHQFQPLAAARQIELIVGASGALMVGGDETKLLRVLSNLVDNALKYAGPGSRVVLAATRVGEAVALTVTDNGPGVSAADLPHLLDRFFRGQTGGPEGSGLGLAIAQALTLAQGGTLTLTSEPGRGLTCTVTLPGAR